MPLIGLGSVTLLSLVLFAVKSDVVTRSGILLMWGVLLTVQAGVFL